MYGALRRYRVKLRAANGVEHIVKVDARTDEQASNRALAAGRRLNPSAAWQVAAVSFA